ncbi:hypothetical protein [Halorhodospira halophila]|uniref:hypothetical protein n=1 Tax=Halorhodospira halophila TaxID=1053 RepID=UPI001912E0BB|nr:hypothetical protein [Halorhodospira halophila]
MPQPPEGEIPIVYIGLGEGEKLSEQLLLGEQISGAGYRRILRDVAIAGGACPRRAGV